MDRFHTFINTASNNVPRKTIYRFYIEMLSDSVIFFIAIHYSWTVGDESMGSIFLYDQQVCEYYTANMCH